MNNPICAYHNKEMVLKTGPYGQFWSCGTRMQDGAWCKYRPQEQYMTPQAPQTPQTQPSRIIQGVPPPPSTIKGETDWNAIGLAKASSLLWAAILPYMLEHDQEWGRAKDAIHFALTDIEFIQTGHEALPISEDIAPPFAS